MAWKTADASETRPRFAYASIKALWDDTYVEVCGHVYRGVRGAPQCGAAPLPFRLWDDPYEGTDIGV